MKAVRQCLANLWWRREASCILETALLTPILILLIAGAVDFGRGFTLAIEVSSAAHAGALYGTQNPTDTTGMKEAAKQDAPDISNLSAAATYGCECADGSAVSPSCAVLPENCPDNYVYYVSVTATTAYTPILRYPFLPATLNLSSRSRLRAGGD